MTLYDLDNNIVDHNYEIHISGWRNIYRLLDMIGYNLIDFEEYEEPDIDKLTKLISDDSSIKYENDLLKITKNHKNFFNAIQEYFIDGITANNSTIYIIMKFYD